MRITNVPVLNYYNRIYRIDDNAYTSHQVVFCAKKGKLTFKAEKSKIAAFVSRDASAVASMEKRELDVGQLLGSTPPDRFVLSESDPVMR